MSLSGRYWGQGGQHLLVLSITGFDRSAERNGSPLRADLVCIPIHGVIRLPERASRVAAGGAGEIGVVKRSQNRFILTVTAALVAEW